MPRKPSVGTALVILAEVGVPLVILIVFVLLRDSPPDYDCGDTEPPGQDARLEAFRSGAIPMFVAGAAVLGAALAWLSRERMRAVGRFRPLGLPTAIVLAVMAAYTAASLIDHDVFYVLGLAGALALIIIAFPFEGAPNPGLWAIALAVAGALGWLATRWSVRPYVLPAIGWFELLVLLPGTLLLIFRDGTGPLLC